MKRIAVYCGSSSGSDPAYLNAADALGRTLAREKIELVYGGGGVGLMGRVASAALDAGGHVIGVIPKFLLEKEKGDLQLPDQRVVTSMHERKALMADLADGFIAMPGGFGTLEELCETVTWGQLGLHVKPFGLLNVAGFYDHFLTFLDLATERQFIKQKYRDLVLTDGDCTRLLDKMRNWHHAAIPQRITAEGT
ncbi:MAG TPA: TIGR00730 family Rossman fold protein [Phycisphaerae bacterium]|nr:TIGR00730 family Rossman fold protein [Phycisphaerae bacterium]